MKTKVIFNQADQKYYIKIYFLHGKPCNRFVPMLMHNKPRRWMTEESANEFIKNELKEYWNKLPQVFTN